MKNNFECPNVQRGPDDIALDVAHAAGVLACRCGSYHSRESVDVALGLQKRNEKLSYGTSETNKEGTTNLPSPGSTLMDLYEVSA